MQNYTINCHWRIFTFRSVKCKLIPQIFRACFSKTVTGSIWILSVTEAQHSTSISQLHNVFTSTIKHSKDFKNLLKRLWNEISLWILNGVGSLHKWNATWHSPSWIHHHITTLSKYLNFKLFHSCQVSQIQFPNVVHPVTVLLKPTVTPQSACNITSMCTFKNSHLTTRAGWNIT